jgi:hypothetical protein
MLRIQLNQTTGDPFRWFFETDSCVGSSVSHAVVKRLHNCNEVFKKNFACGESGKALLTTKTQRHKDHREFSRLRCAGLIRRFLGWKRQPRISRKNLQDGIRGIVA